MLKDSAPPAGHVDSSTSSASSFGLPRHRGISSRCGSDRHLCSASAAVSPHPYGTLGLCEIYPQVFTPAQSPSLTKASTRSARREAASTCVGQCRSRSSLEGEVPCSRTRLPLLCTTTARKSSALSFGLPHQIPPLSLVLDHGMGIQMGR